MIRGEGKGGEGRRKEKEWKGRVLVSGKGREGDGKEGGVVSGKEREGN